MKMNACILEVFVDDVPIVHTIINGKLDNYDALFARIDEPDSNLRLYIYTAGMQGTIPVAPHAARPIIHALLALRKANKNSVLSAILHARPFGAPVQGTIKPDTVYQTCLESARQTGVPVFQFEVFDADLSVRQVAWLLKQEPCHIDLSLE